MLRANITAFASTLGNSKVIQVFKAMQKLQGITDDKNLTIDTSLQDKTSGMCFDICLNILFVFMHIVSNVK